MKRIIMMAMAIVMMLAAIGGCLPWRYEDGGRGRDGGYDSGHSNEDRRTPRQ